MTRMWCSNCNQWVIPQNNTGLFWVVLLLGMLLVLTGLLLPGGLAIGVALVGILTGSVRAPHCPLCKDNLRGRERPTTQVPDLTNQEKTGKILIYAALLLGLIAAAKILTAVLG